MSAKISLNKLYSFFLTRYKSQHWWPIIFAHKKRDRQLEVMLGAVLTQNTAWRNVEMALANLEKAGLLSWDRLARIRRDKLARLIRPARYFNQKAGYLKNLVLAFEKNPDAFGLSLLGSRGFLLKIKGIGPETADSILLYAFSYPIFVVDAYTLRVFSRLGLVRKNARYKQIQDFVRENLSCHRRKCVTMYNELHALIVRHAVEYCRVKPDCEECVLKKYCRKSQ